MSTGMIPCVIITTLASIAYGAGEVEGVKCSAPMGESCFESHCCANGNYGCYKRPGRDYAQCRPLPDHGVTCSDSNEWECPGWWDCASNYEGCLDTKCCKSSNFACSKKPEGQYAQCRPKVDNCHDTAEWLCPGWELCTNAYESCTNTHCCNDKRFTCYQKTEHFAQCLKTGTCTNGMCKEVDTTYNAGECSASYQDCRFTACCKNSADHCYLKNDNYGTCLSSCDEVSKPGWTCKLHEIASEAYKTSCAELKDSRNNIGKSSCALQLDGLFCNKAYRSFDFGYFPCMWSDATNSCSETGQKLNCGCEVHGRGCVYHHADIKTNNNDVDVEWSTTEIFIMALAVVIILGGLGGLVWIYMYYIRADDNLEMESSRGILDDPPPPPSSVSGKKRSKKSKIHEGEELEHMTDSTPTEI